MCFLTMLPLLAPVLCPPCIAGVGCAAGPRVEAAARQVAPHTITVSMSSPTSIPGESLTIALLGVKDDRCAVEVKCVWAGHAELTLQVSKAGAAPAPVVLGALPAARDGAPQEAAYGEYRFRLQSLEPANSIAKPVEQSRYRATLIVTKP